MDSDNQEKPVVAARCPFRRELFPGQEYLYCTCGKAKEQPFCDNSCEGSKFTPLKFHVEKYVKSALLCGCKRNSKEAGPYCDGSHSHVDLDW